MTEQIIEPSDDEISLLDILVTLAEAWRLLIIGPLVVAILAGGVSFLVPKTYESIASLRLNDEEIALLHTAPVLDPLIDKFGFLAKADGVKDDARQLLKQNLSYSIDKKTKLATLVAKGTSPEDAQALGRNAVEVLLIELQPKGQEREAIVQKMALNHQLIADGVGTFRRSSNKTSDDKTGIVDPRADNIELSLKLKARGAEVFAQEPSLSSKPVSPKRSLIIVLASLASVFVLLLFVFVRKAWRGAVQDESAAIKIQQIKRSLGLSKS